jgi:hypothetical protein
MTVQDVGSSDWLGLRLGAHPPRASRADQPTKRSAESHERTDSVIDVQTVTRIPFEKWELNRAVLRERGISGKVTSEEQQGDSSEKESDAGVFERFPTSLSAT